MWTWRSPGVLSQAISQAATVALDVSSVVSGTARLRCHLSSTYRWECVEVGHAKGELDEIIKTNSAQISGILRDYGVPLVCSATLSK